MIINVRTLPSLDVASPHPSALATRWTTNSNLRRHCRRCSPSAISPARMVLATDSVVDTDTAIVDAPVQSWKPPWDRRRETSGMLTGVQYDTGAMEAFFEHRPERASARFAQIVLEAVGAVLALASDQLANKLFAVGLHGSGSGSGNGDGDVDRPTGGAPGHIRRAVTRLGPNFVKIGQALASRPDLVGESIAGELLLLQDAMPFFSHEIARDFIHEELGAYPEDVFEGMGIVPVAAASLGQVYKASIDGRAVAVKVQRPDLLEAVALDFYLARGIAAAIMRLSRSPVFFGGRVEVRSDLVAAVDEYGSRLFEELDYRKEAQNMVRFRELYGDMPSVVVPEVLLEFSGKRVITSEWIDGEKLVDDQAQVSPVDLPILRVGIDCTLTQLLDKGFLHADPHGGNLLKTADKRLAYLDFGLVSVIPPGVMDALICATVYVMNRDYIALAKGFPALALMSEGDLSDDFGPFASALEGALDPIVTDFRRQMGLDGGSGDEAPSGSERVAFAQVIDRVFLLARSFNFSVPPYFISNVRALGELEGLAMTADPGFNLISVVYPYVCRRLLSDPNPSLRAALKDLIVAGDGSLRWEVVEALMRDSNALDERVGAGGETRQAPLDLSLEFILSVEGAFVRRAVMSDLRRAALSSMRKKNRILRGRRPSSQTPAPSSATATRKKSGRGSEDDVPALEGDEGLVRVNVPGGATARNTSRQLLRGRALREARRRPILVARVVASIVAAAGRAVGTAFLVAVQRTRFSRRRRAAGAGATI